MISWLCSPNPQSYTHLPSTKRISHLHAKSEYSNDNFHYKCQGQLPHGTVDSRTSRSVGQFIPLACVETVFIITELGGIQKATVIKQLRNELTCAHSSVFIRESQDGSDGCHNEYLYDRILAQLGGLTLPTPGNVCADKQSSPQTTKYAQQDEWHKLKEMPWSVKLHVKQNQAAVPKWIDGTQSKCCHQGSKK